MITERGIEKSRLVENALGYRFDPVSHQWHLSREGNVNVEWLDTLTADPLTTSFRETLKHYAVIYSPAYAFNMSQRLLAFIRALPSPHGPLKRITVPTIINYRSTLNSRTEWKLGSIRVFLRKLTKLGLGGVDPAALTLLGSLKFRRNPHGEAVRLKCAKKGALSTIEFEALNSRIIDAFESGSIALDDFVLITLFAATGRRPAQLGDLKHVDFIEVCSSDGLSESVLNVPRRKQRGVEWRGQFKPVALTPEVGLALKSLIRENLTKLPARYRSLAPGSVDLCPLFPNWEAIEEAKTKPPSAIGTLLKSDAFHSRSARLRARLEVNVSSLTIPSERTGKPLHVFPTRLRRTVATNAAREGYSSLAIAEILDHSSDSYARVYTENVPEHVDAINAAVAHQLAPLAQAFAGVLIDSESDATRGDDHTSRIRTDSGSAAGSCGKSGFCGACAPVACYTCSRFEPWLDGDHGEVLENLLSERTRIMDRTGDAVVASVNDRTIFAVSEVIRRCDQRKEELKKAKNDGRSDPVRT